MSFSSDELNYLIYRYLKEAGMAQRFLIILTNQDLIIRHLPLGMRVM